jgi:hypothetical protein
MEAAVLRVTHPSAPQGHSIKVVPRASIENLYSSVVMLRFGFKSEDTFWIVHVFVFNVLD